MKKLSYLIVLALILGLVLTGCSLLSNVGQVPTSEQSGMSYLTKGAGDEITAEQYPLYAGKDTAVGVVKVWNDIDTLYVKYIVDDPWCLMETHLHVALDSNSIPQKNGNPIPGKFKYKMEHNCEPYYKYSIEMSLMPSDVLYIAAHAKVSGAPKDSANGVMYATRALTGGTKGLYEIDVVQGVSDLLQTITGGAGDVGNGTGYTNGLAYDPFYHKLYFTAPPRVNVSPSPLWSYDTNTGELTKLMDLPDSVVSASFYNGAYYYIAEGVNSLMKVEVNSLSCVPTVVCSGFGTASDFTFGDFAISRRGILYGSTRVSPQMFFSLDLASCEYYEFYGSNALDLQLAYGSDGKLYGINHGSGNSYEINVGTGIAIPISFNFVGAADLASGELGVPTTESAWAATGIGQLPFDGKNWATYFTYTHDGCCILDITAVNGYTGYTHYFTISYDPDTELFTGTGTSPHAGNQSLSEIILKDNKISFRSDYDATSYFWFPSFILEDDGSLTFVDGYGSDNVTSATGTWEISYDCNGD